MRLLRSEEARASPCWPADPQRLWFEPLYTEEMVLVVAPTHPLAQRKRVRMVELHRQSLVLLPRAFTTRVLLDGCFQSCGAEPVVAAEMNTIAPMLGAGGPDAAGGDRVTSRRGAGAG